MAKHTTDQLYALIQNLTNRLDIVEGRLDKASEYVRFQRKQIAELQLQLKDQLPRSRHTNGLSPAEVERRRQVLAENKAKAMAEGNTAAIKVVL